MQYAYSNFYVTSYLLTLFAFINSSSENDATLTSYCAHENVQYIQLENSVFYRCTFQTDAETYTQDMSVPH